LPWSVTVSAPLGCAAYLAKLFEIDDLLALLRRYLPEA